MMKLFYKVILILLFLSTTYASDIKYVTQELSGEIKLNYETKIILPPGNWYVSAITKTHQFPVWNEVGFIQTDGSDLKAFLFIGYPKEPSAEGWYKGSYDACDDYEGQQSNFHEKNYKTQVNVIMSGYCSAIYANNEIDQSLWDSWDVMRETHSSIANKGIKQYPASMIHVDSKLYSKSNLVDIYYAYNPKFTGFSSKRGVSWTDSEWSKYKIDDFPKKKSFMEKIISNHKQTILNNTNSLKKRKPVDLSLYNF